MFVSGIRTVKQSTKKDTDFLSDVLGKLKKTHVSWCCLEIVLYLLTGQHGPSDTILSPGQPLRAEQSSKVALPRGLPAICVHQERVQNSNQLVCSLFFSSKALLCPVTYRQPCMTPALGQNSSLLQILQRMLYHRDSNQTNNTLVIGLDMWVWGFWRK